MNRPCPCSRKSTKINTVVSGRGSASPVSSSISRGAMTVCVAAALAGRRFAGAFVGHTSPAVVATLSSQQYRLRPLAIRAISARLRVVESRPLPSGCRSKRSDAASAARGGARRRGQGRRPSSHMKADLTAACAGGETSMNVNPAADIGLTSTYNGGSGQTVTMMDGGEEEPPPPPQQQQQQQQQLPFATEYHVPVVCKEVLDWLITDRDGVYVDCTLGGGGHSAALLGALGSRARVVGLDRDPAALREASARLSTEAETGRFRAVHANFADVTRAVRGCELLLRPRLDSSSSGTNMRANGRSPSPPPLLPVDELGLQEGDQAREEILVDGILVDLGVSSRQIDDGARGFSFSADGPLDMRMDGGGGDLTFSPEIASERKEEEEGRGGTSSSSSSSSSPSSSSSLSSAGDGPLSAADVVNYVDEREIRELIFRLGEEKRSTKIARAIVSSRPIATTGRLAEVVGACAPPNQRTKTLARVFQALRIKVNGELDALEAFLNQAKEIVKPGGRLVVLSYHSLEDRRVKRVLATGNLEGAVVKDFYGNLLNPWKPLTRKPLQATEEEVALNPRARSVRLRVAERTGVP